MATIDGQARMRRIIFLGVLIAMALPLRAQDQIAEERSWQAVDFRYSRSATNFASGLEQGDAGDGNSVGMVVGFQRQRFIGGFRYEHDFQGVFDLIARSFDLDSIGFSRDRYELTAGYAVTPAIAIEGGIRNERIVFNPALALQHFALSTEYGAILGGLRVQTPREQRVGFEGSVHTYLGGSGWSREAMTDTRGYRAEAGFPIQSGAARIVPGVAYEHLRTGPRQLELDAWRFFISLGFSSFSDPNRIPD